MDKKAQKKEIMNDKIKVGLYLKKEQKQKLDSIYAYYLANGNRSGYGEIIGQLIDELHEVINKSINVSYPTQQ